MFHSYLIIHPNPVQRREYIRTFLKKLAVHPVDILTLENPLITIAEVRSIKTFLSLKPFAGDYKAVIILGDHVTPEAQQALLKTLEEPPTHSLLFIETQNVDTLLPTIVSRCHIIRPNSTGPIHPDEGTLQTSAKYWNNLFNASFGENLSEVNNIATDREKVKEWLIKQIYFFREELLLLYEEKNSLKTLTASNYVQLIQHLNQTLVHIENNVSLKLALDHLMLSLPKLLVHLS